MKSKADESSNGNGTLPRSGACLDHVTKGRVKGPQGRRLPRKPQKSNGIDSKADSVLESDEETAIRDSRGRATSFSALEASTESHSKIRLEFELKSGDEDHSSDSLSTGSPAFPNQSPNTNRLSFEHAWFLTLPDSHHKSGGKTEDEDSTSDYSSMHGSPSTKSSKRSPSASPTNPPERLSFKSRIEKFLCSLL
jgi:hypothetical protein